MNLSSSELARVLILSVLALGASVWDLKSRRVPNVLTVPIALAGLGLALVDNGWSGFGWAMAGLLVGGGIFIPFVAFGYVGSGDMKLMAAAGSFLGPLGIIRGLLVGSILGGFWAVGWLMAKKDRKSTLPYAPPLAAGTLIAFFY